MSPSKRSTNSIKDILRYLAEVDHTHLNDGTIVYFSDLSDDIKRLQRRRRPDIQPSQDIAQYVPPGHEMVRRD